MLAELFGGSTTSVPTREPQRGFATTLVVTLAVAISCGEHAAPPRTSEAEMPATTDPADPARDSPREPMPPAGSARLQIRDGRVTLHANAAPRRALLETLARQLDFELVSGDLGDEPISITANGEALREVLPRLLPDRAYRVDYRYARYPRDARGARGTLDQATRARHEVARLEVAPLGVLALEAPQSDALSASRAERPRSAAGLAESERNKLLSRLDDADPEERMDALRQIDAEGQALGLITERLANDPDPRVRVVAAERLDFAETLPAVDALVLALGDADRRVVLAAIDALEFTEDTSVVHDLEALLEHSDPEIAQNAQDAIDFIRDDD